MLFGVVDCCRVRFVRCVCSDRCPLFRWCWGSLAVGWVSTVDGRRSFSAGLVPGLVDLWLLFGHVGMGVAVVLADFGRGDQRVAVGPYTRATLPAE